MDVACEERAHGFVELVACWDGALCHMEASEEFAGDGHGDGSLEAAGRVVAKDLLSSEIERGACAGCNVELRVAWRAVDGDCGEESDWDGAGDLGICGWCEGRVHCDF